MSSETTNEKLFGIASYLTILWLIPYFMAKGNARTSFVVFHLKQGFLVLLLSLIIFVLKSLEFGLLLSFFFWLVQTALIIICILMILTGIINVAQGTNKEIPYIGKLANTLCAWIK